MYKYNSNQMNTFVNKKDMLEEEPKTIFSEQPLVDKQEIVDANQMANPVEGNQLRGMMSNFQEAEEELCSN